MAPVQVKKVRSPVDDGQLCIWLESSAGLTFIILMAVPELYFMSRLNSPINIFSYSW